jgi:acyl carrier protein
MNDCANKKRPNAIDIENWLVVYLSKELDMRPDEIDVTMPFDRYGLSSLQSVIMTGDLNDWIGYEVDPTLPYDYPCIKALAQYLANTIPSCETV